MAIWDDTLTERDKQVFAKSGYGKRPALLVIDMNYNFVGDKPEPIVKSIVVRVWPRNLYNLD